MAILSLSPAVKSLLQQEAQYCAGGFEPLPAFITQARGSILRDVDGKEYIDFIHMFSAVNFGHGNPYITEKVLAQYQKVSLVNLAARNPLFPPFAKALSERLGLAKVASLNSGTEAADAACKIARKWGITVKGINPEECLILGVGSSYHGLGQGTWGLMDPSPQRKEYGLDSRFQTNCNPSTGESLTYLDVDAMKRCIEANHQRIAAVIMECIHGTSRDVQDEIRYAKGVNDLCKQYNILFIADEVRQGAGKTGKFVSYQHMGEDFKPDIVTLGKSITGGFYPQSFIVGTDPVMSLVGKYEIGGSFGATPIGIVAAQAALEVLDRDGLLQRATELGDLWRGIVESWNHPLVDFVACIGADSNLVLTESVEKRLAALCFHRGLFVYTRPQGLRISFALTMTDDELRRGAEIIHSALEDVAKYEYVEGE
ncbi:hypothetical protein CPLU01_02018 [Colletotrichum plurivorum]|uniref:Ornithine aminotransferase n=1 Tax=Colletotrichum plurivorum TaxID=2175906 RepID=A0A8H6KXU2_9PEZI|nr:hypothetical protein CPLU01_02018 [Colletotrichum plurivorum]